MAGSQEQQESQEPETSTEYDAVYINGVGGEDKRSQYDRSRDAWTAMYES